MTETTLTKKRRANGEGYVGQRSDGRWQAKLSLPDGQRRTFYGRTRTEAVAKLAAARIRKREGRGCSDPLTAHRRYRPKQPPLEATTGTDDRLPANLLLDVLTVF